MSHLITTKDLSVEKVAKLFEDAQEFKDGNVVPILSDRLIMTLFFENSTRTRSSFDVAAQRLGAKIVHLDVTKSSTNKGETLYDTAANLDAMKPDAIIVRHQYAGVPASLSEHVEAKIINAGDGAHAHPTQALLDLFTITRHIPNPEGKTIAIVGDIKNSRVANSNIELLSRFGLNIILVAPPHFLMKTNLRTSHSLKDVIDEVDIIMSLRTQTERHRHSTYASLKDYAGDFCITKELVGSRDLLLLHPGPVHRNVDIDDAMLADERSKILEQVENGVYIRMAILKNAILG